MQRLRRGPCRTVRRKSKNKRRRTSSSGITDGLRMAERKPEWPEVGDLVIPPIETVTDYGTYAKLAENYKRAEEVLQKTAKSVVSNIIKAGGQGTFRREK
jgi:translation initiation factor 2 alpha subunit (eIF-2alpha)